jgi:predicted DCC family thiol-disulfide oxidoreductase YuxK
MPKGWVLYDGECAVCRSWLRLLTNVLARKGFVTAMLQEPWVAERLGRDGLLSDLRLLTSDGKIIAGADAYLYVMRRIWWTWPLYALFNLPGFKTVFRAGYRWFANNRYCVSSACRLDRK